MDKFENLNVNKIYFYNNGDLCPIKKTVTKNINDTFHQLVSVLIPNTGYNYSVLKRTLDNVILNKARSHYDVEVESTLRSLRHIINTI